jgi:hypothetical protein
MKISGRLNLLMLQGAIMNMKSKCGMVDCLVIPIEKNNLFKSEKGLYLDLIAFELSQKKENSKDTHLVKQSLSKQKRESMTEEDLKNMPILGNLSVWSDGFDSQQPNINTYPISENDDLPF